MEVGLVGILYVGMRHRSPSLSLSLFLHSMLLLGSDGYVR